MVAKPRGRQYTIEERGDTLRISIPSPKKWSTIIFSVFWLALWLLIGGGIREKFGGEADVFLRLWNIFWVVGVIVGIYLLLWQLVGKEEIEVAPDSIAIHQAILGIGWSKVYASEHIRRLRTDAAGRIEPLSLNPEGEGVILSKGTGMIAFDYKENQIRMGIGIDEAEAKELVAKIQRIIYNTYNKRG